jgi:hypothetical protein
VSHPSLSAARLQLETLTSFQEKRVGLDGERRKLPALSNFPGPGCFSNPISCLIVFPAVTLHHMAFFEVQVFPVQALDFLGANPGKTTNRQRHNLIPFRGMEQPSHPFGSTTNQRFSGNTANGG